MVIFNEKYVTLFILVLQFQDVTINEKNLNQLITHFLNLTCQVPIIFHVAVASGI